MKRDIFDVEKLERKLECIDGAHDLRGERIDRGQFQYSQRRSPLLVSDQQAQNVPDRRPCRVELSKSRRWMRCPKTEVPQSSASLDQIDGLVLFWCPKVARMVTIWKSDVDLCELGEAICRSCGQHGVESREVVKEETVHRADVVACPLPRVIFAQTQTASTPLWARLECSISTSGDEVSEFDVVDVVQNHNFVLDVLIGANGS